MQRLTAPTDWPRLPHPDAVAVTNLVVDMQVADERSSAAHYAASFTFRFNPKAVRQMLRDAGINFSELASKPVVVVPLFKSDGQEHLWDDPNPWRDAWNAGAGRYGLVPWIVPAGDLADVSTFDAPDVAQPRPDKLQALSQRYGDGDVTIVTATREGNHLDISVARYNVAGTADTASTGVDAAAADAQLYQAGVQAAEQLLENQWKAVSLPPPAVVAAGAQTVELSAPVAGPGDWARIQDRLDRVPTIQKIDIELMTRKEVRLKLTASGDLKTALAQQDLLLAPGTPYGTLSARAASVAAPVSATTPPSE